MTNQTNIKVCVRCRPFIANELLEMQNKEPPFYINENSIELKNQDPTLTKSMNFGRYQQFTNSLKPSCRFCL